MYLFWVGVRLSLTNHERKLLHLHFKVFTTYSGDMPLAQGD